MCRHSGFASHENLPRLLKMTVYFAAPAIKRTADQLARKLH